MNNDQWTAQIGELIIENWALIIGGLIWQHG